MSIYFHKPISLFGSSLATGVEQERFHEIRKEIEVFYSNTGREVIFDNFVKTLELIERTKSHLGLKRSSNVIQEVIFYLRAKLLSTDPYMVKATYILLDYLVKNGGPLIHNSVNNVRVIKTITTVARTNYFNDHGKGSKMVADVALDIIQGWGEAFEKEFRDTRYQNIIHGFHNLRQKYGIIYPRKPHCSSRVKIFLGRSSKFRYEYDFVPEETKAPEASGSGRTAGFSDDPDLLEFSDLELGSPRDVLNETVSIRFESVPPEYGYNYNYNYSADNSSQSPQRDASSSYIRYDGFDRSPPSMQLLHPSPPSAPPTALIESHRAVDLRVLERDNVDTLQLSLMQTSSSKKKKQQQEGYAININEEKKSFDAIDFFQHRQGRSEYLQQESAYKGPSFNYRDSSPEPEPKPEPEPISYRSATQVGSQPAANQQPISNPFDDEQLLHSPRPTAEPKEGRARSRPAHSSYFDPSSDPDNVITFYGTQRIVRKAPAEKKSYAL